MLHRPALVLIPAALALAACAHDRVETGLAGQRPAPSSVGFAPDSLSSGKFAVRIKDGLVGQGFTLSDQPVYRVDLTLAEIPGRAGLYVPAAQEGERVWTVAPSRSRASKTYRATISFTDVASGREIMRAYAHERRRRAPADEETHLADALLSQIAMQAPMTSPAPPPDESISSKRGG